MNSNFVSKSYTAGQLNSIVKKIRDQAGENGIELLLQGKLKIIVDDATTINCDTDPFIPSGWSIEEHRKGGQFKWNPSSIELFVSEEQQKKYIKGNKLRKILKDRGVLNANVLDYLLANPHLISEEWKGKWIFFWGTIYRSSDGCLCVRCLRWLVGRWRWDARWLDSDWYDVCPAALRASI